MIFALDARPLLTRHITGIETHARNIVTQWARTAADHQFLLLSDDVKQQEPDAAFVAELPSDRFEQFSVSGLAHHVWNNRWTGRFDLGLDVSSHIPGSLARVLKKQGVQVFHSFSPQVPHTNICPVVQTIHDLSVELDPAVRGLATSRAERRVMRTGAQDAARIVAVSLQTQADIASVYDVPEEKIAVIHNGINAAYNPEPDLGLRSVMRDQYRITGSYVLAVGSDIPRRNYWRVLEAMNVVWQELPHVKLLFAGRNDWPTTTVHQRAKAAGVLDRLIFVDSPTDPQLAQLYRDAAIVCCASSFEGFGLSVLEGLACGTPVACSDMRSLREVAADAAVYFVHDDTTSIGQTLLGVIEDGEYRRQLRYRGIQRAKQFTWSATAAQLLDVLTQVARA